MSLASAASDTDSFLAAADSASKVGAVFDVVTVTSTTAVSSTAVSAAPSPSSSSLTVTMTV